MVVGMRLGYMTFKDRLLLSAGIMSNKCFGKSRENIEEIIKQYAETLFELLLDRDDMVISNS
jgi:hypothetical protein